MIFKIVCQPSYLLFSSFNLQSSGIIVKYEDWIRGGRPYREEVETLSSWCKNNNHEEEMVGGFRKRKAGEQTHPYE